MAFIQTVDRFAICPAPDAHPRPPSRFAMPKGAVDAHTHFIGTPPYVEDRSYTPWATPAEDYLAMLDTVGIGYGVLVQVSVHGTDNSLMLDFMKQHPQRFRGVAVAPHDLSAREWQSLRDGGITGLRLNALAGGGIGLQHLDRYEEICEELGWHLQFMTSPSQLASVATRLSKLRVPAVIDHMGAFPASEGSDSPNMRLMLNLLSDGAWVKLSGAFRLSDAAHYADTVPIARALIEAAPNRCVWGSDWPHVAFYSRMPNVGDLLDLLADWAPDDEQRRRILVDNAHALYGFCDSSETP